MEPCPPAAQPLTPDIFQPGAAMRDRGPLWKIGKDGTHSYLYGTLHVGRRDWLPPGATVLAALRESETVALELDPLDLQPQALQGYVPRRGAAPLPAPLQKRLDAAWRAECLPDAMRLGATCSPGVKKNVEPTPGSDSHQMRPPWRSTIFLT